MSATRCIFVVREVLPSGDEEALELASRMRLVRIPEKGFINYRPGIQGRGRWDGHNSIFRCIVIRQRCGDSECNKRMWYQLDRRRLGLHFNRRFSLNMEDAPDSPESLAIGSSDLRFLLSSHNVDELSQAKLCENGIDTLAKFAAFVK